MALGSERILPYQKKENKGTQIRRMFDAIAHSYDKLNRLMSLGFDRGWRRQGVAFLRPFAPKTILDIASGTGDLAILMQQRLQAEKVIGADISEGMMEIGRKKAMEAGCGDKVLFEYQDCMSLSYPDSSFDAVTAAFGVRNFEHIEQGLQEMYRVLKPGGHVMILELSTPTSLPMKALYRFYSRTVIPFLGGFLSQEKAAYTYLPESIKVVPQGKEMTELLARQGFKETRARTFTFGACSMYTGTKAE